MLELFGSLTALLHRSELDIPLGYEKLADPFVVASCERLRKLRLEFGERWIRLPRAVLRLLEDRLPPFHELDEQLGKLVECDLTDIEMLSEERRDPVQDAVGGAEAISAVNSYETPRCRFMPLRGAVRAAPL